MIELQDLATDEPLSDQVFHQLLALLRLKRQYDHLIGNAQGLKSRDFSVLRFLLEMGPVKVSEIQAFLHHSPSTTSTLIAQLEEAGYVTRTRSDDDNRVVIVSLTAVGQTVAEQAPFGGLPLLRRRLAHLPEERLQEIGGALAELMQLMESEPTS